MNTRVRRTGFKLLWGLTGLVFLVCGVLVGRARWVILRSYADVPEPPIAADHSAAAVARGELLFQSLCMECHSGVDGRATGKHLEEVPEFLGDFYSANLAHPERGVLQRTDGQLARVLRLGVLPDGRLSPAMNAFGRLGDADVAALLGYMRSGAPELQPAGGLQPETELSLAGSVILTYIAGINVDAPLQGVPVPAKAPNVEYGRYMATVLDCVTCHTAGFSSDKHNHAEALAGGFALTDPTGTQIYTKNITLDPATGIGSWSLDDFERALTQGATPEGMLVRKPMPLFSRLDRTDVTAIYEFLKTMPQVVRANQPGGHPLQKAQVDDPPEVLFVSVGCAVCHANGNPFRDKLNAAVHKSDADVAAWILNPQAVRPGSPMPSFEGALEPAQAEQLAKYVKQLAQAGGS
jgi:mono/diheme cytochrome c family protein